MSELLPGTLLNNNYRIIKLIGKGGMGTVYLAEEVTRPENKYAIKELISNFQDHEQEQIAFQTFNKEIQFLSQLNHNQLPLFYGTFSHMNRHYLVMEYVEGENLESILQKKEGPLPVDDVLYWGIEIANVLNHLHTQSSGPIVYRDIKPANIIITLTGCVKLVDFGIARRYDPSKVTDTLRFGTPGYAAPEQFKSAKLGQSTPKSDIYGLGVILFQLLTGYDPTITPFHFPSIKYLNSAVSGELEKIINKAIHLKPEMRYENMAAFRDTLIMYSREKYQSHQQLPVLRKEKQYLEEVKESRHIKEAIRQDRAPMKVYAKAIVSLGTFICTFGATSGLTLISCTSTFGTLLPEHIPVILWVGFIPALILSLAILLGDFRYY
ncbi:MAG TPA: serine/threonine-protein kinase [Candidatus Eremiobacteraeota bacterium]|nr:MAG: Serine/threonine-protein kinase PrkC [bacterium ADurb.Bin363]HPZ09140.1 serine/threonine-protein kinase [Candidatus Eremiobacteraeota bacterium]